MKAVQHLPAGYREIYAIDMLKVVRCLRVQGRFPAAPRQCPQIMQTRGKFMDVIARSEATWQSVLFAAAQNEKQHFGRIRKALRICPKDYQFAKFLCGDADCHTSVRTGSQ